MDDAVVFRKHAVVRQSELGGILRQRVHLFLRYRILDGFVLIMSRGVMVWHTIDLLGTETLQSPAPHPVEGLR